MSATGLRLLPDLVDRGAERFATATALAQLADSGVGSLSYLQLHEQVSAGTHTINRAGLAPGDRVLLLARADTGWLPAFFSILASGLVAVPLPLDTPAPVIAAASRLVQAKAVLGPSNLADNATAARCLLPLESLFENATTRGRPGVQTRPDDTAVLVFTSGSTQSPRAVAHTHAGLLANLQAVLEVGDTVADEIVLSVLPPAHLFELMTGQLCPLAVGARIVYAGTLLPNRLVEALRAEHITRVMIVPALLDVLYQEVVEALVDARLVEPSMRELSMSEAAHLLVAQANNPDAAHLLRDIRQRFCGSLRSVVVGGAAFDPAWTGIFSAMGVTLEIGYGLAEAGPVVATGHMADIPAGSVGRALPGVEVRIGEHSEILVRSPSVMQHYFGDPHNTALTLRRGWLHTGDCGYLDRHGFLFVTGRLKEAIVTAGGDTIYPEEIEEHYRDPLFAEHCVVPLPTVDGNDRAVLAVLPSSQEVSDAEIEAAFQRLRADAPPRCKVSEVRRLTAALPRTAIGKVRRRALADDLARRDTPHEAIL